MSSKLLAALSMCLLAGSAMARSTNILVSPPVQSAVDNTLVCVAQNTDTSNSHFAEASLIDADGNVLVSSGPPSTEIVHNGFADIVFAASTGHYAYCRFITSHKNVRGYIGLVTDEGTALIHEASQLKGGRSSSFIFTSGD
ncbi:MAG: hypothetical protein ACU833_14865 [Gammaproteobacteria bacterium]